MPDSTCDSGMGVGRINCAESALGDLTGIQECDVADDSPDVGDRFVAEIVHRLEVLADHSAFRPAPNPASSPSSKQEAPD